MPAHVAGLGIGGRVFPLVGKSEQALSRVASFAPMVASKVVSYRQTAKILDSFAKLPISQQRAILGSR